MDFQRFRTVRQPEVMRFTKEFAFCKIVTADQAEYNELFSKRINEGFEILQTSRFDAINNGAKIEVFTANLRKPRGIDSETENEIIRAKHYKRATPYES
jgi:hypothetical protein